MKRQLVRSLATAILGALISAACYSIAGASLDLLLSGVLFTAILAPALANARVQQNLVGSTAFTIGVSTIWLTIPSGWISAALVLLAFGAAVIFATQALIRLRVHVIAARAIVSTIALAWLTWPVWASPYIAGKTIGWPVTLHPLFALNASCRESGMWTEQRFAYQLTNLGQDAPYQLPSSALACVVFHGALAAMFALIPNKSKADQPNAQISEPLAHPDVKDA